MNHEQIVRVRLDSLRALGFLPRDVEVLAVVCPTPGVTDLHLHIACSIAFSHPPNTPLIIESLLDFYDRYIALRRQWSDDLASQLAAYQSTGGI